MEGISREDGCFIIIYNYIGKLYLVIKQLCEIQKIYDL